LFLVSWRLSQIPPTVIPSSLSVPPATRRHCYNRGTPRIHRVTWFSQSNVFRAAILTDKQHAADIPFEAATLQIHVVKPTKRAARRKPRCRVPRHHFTHRYTPQIHVVQPTKRATRRKPRCRAPRHHFIHRCTPQIHVVQPTERSARRKPRCRAPRRRFTHRCTPQIHIVQTIKRSTRTNPYYRANS
jgi:hypothetical protein